MEIKIGIKHSPRELSFETLETSEAIEKTVSQAMESGSKLVSLSDAKGNRFLIPTEAIAYLEIGAEETRRVGFIS
jgi:hypothetical protein